MSSSPRHVYVVSVQEHDDGASLVIISGKGGQQDQLIFGPSQKRLIAMLFSASLSELSPTELVREMAQLMRAEEVPIS